MDKHYKAIIIAWLMLLVFSIIFAIWTPNHVTYGIIGYCLGALVMILINFPYIGFLKNQNDFYSKFIYRIMKSKMELLLELKNATSKKKEKRKKKR